MVPLGATATPSTISWSNHHFLAGLRLPLPIQSSNQAAKGTVRGFAQSAFTPTQLAARVSQAPSASTTLLIGQVFMQRPQAEPFGLVTR